MDSTLEHLREAVLDGNISKVIIIMDRLREEVKAVDVDLLRKGFVQDHMDINLKQMCRELIGTGFFQPTSCSVLDLVSRDMSIPWYGLKLHSRGVLEHLMEIREFSLLDDGLKRCQKHPSVSWNPLLLPRQNLVTIAIICSVPFSVLRLILDSLKCVNGDIDDVHKGCSMVGSPLLFVTNTADLVLLDSSVGRDQTTVAEMLMEYGANPLKVCASKSTRTTPLHAAIDAGNKKLAKSMIKALRKSKKRLTLGSKDSSGATALQRLVDAHWLLDAQHLIEIGFDMFDCNNEKVCPFSCLLTCKANKETNKLLNFILSKLTAQDIVTGLSAGLQAEHANALEKYFVENAGIIVQNSHLSSKEQLAIFQCAIDRRCIPAITILMEHLPEEGLSNCWIGPLQSEAPAHMQLTRDLIHRGGNPSIINNSSGGHPSLIQFAVSEGNSALIYELLTLGADVGFLDSAGNSLLHFACQIKEPAARREIVEHIARRAPHLIDLKNHAGELPVQHARGKKAISRLLMNIKNEETEKTQMEATKEDANPSLSIDTTSQHQSSECKKALEAAADPAGNVGEVPEKKDVPASGFEQLRRDSILTMFIDTVESKIEVINNSIPYIQEYISAANTYSQSDVQTLASENGTRSSAAFRDAVQEATPGCSADEESSEENEYADDPNDDMGSWGKKLSSNFEYIEKLRDLCDEVDWNLQISNEPLRSWMAMGKKEQLRWWPVLRKLGRGEWKASKNCKPLKLGNDSKLLKLWRHKIGRSGRLIFEVCVDYNENKDAYMDTIRIWGMTTIYVDYEKTLRTIKNCYSYNAGALDTPKLVPVLDERSDQGRRLPRTYIPVGNTGAKQTQIESAETVEVVLPTNAPNDPFNLLKMTTIGPLLIKCVLEGLDDKDVEFPFKVSPPERAIITKCQTKPLPIILVGRSGTGKTTCAVYRMWSQWLINYMQKTDCNQVFITASATLKNQVEKTFRKLQIAVLTKENRTRLCEQLDKFSVQYPLLPSHYPKEVFPLFVTSKQYLQMLDGTLEKPFLPRNKDGCVQENSGNFGEHNTDGMDLLAILEDPEVPNESEGMGEESDNDIDQDDQGVTEQPSEPHEQRRTHMNYQLYEDILWRKMRSRPECKDLKSSLLFLEIFSYIKGSAEALRTDMGFLSEHEYKQLGKKRAPGYSSKRDMVYKAFGLYQKELKQAWMFDTCDLVHHIYQAITSDGYNGIEIHHIIRDEVQDFCQSEFLLDSRVVANPSGLFYCGDTCQTITRGVGFRFTDIKTLFYEETNCGQQVACSSNSPGPLCLMQLAVNYRTHSGILDVACSVVDVLQRYFPEYMDKLPRESAFFKGPPPSLLHSHQEKDILNLVMASGSTSVQEVEFGAHQVVLVRSMDSFPLLPEPLRNGALVLTIPQAKGLEFDDVFIVNFFKDSPASREWRVLNAYLGELEEEQKNSTSTTDPLEDVHVENVIKGFLRKEEFAADKFVLLCEELKHLYTAVTRAKRNLIFFDSSVEKRTPFFHYLQRRGLARQMKNTGDEGSAWIILSKPANKPEDWRKRGHQFMKNRLFDLALACFENAREPIWALISSAGDLIEKARLGDSQQDQSAMYLEAAHKYLTAAKNVSHCQENVDGKTVKKWLAVCAHSLTRAQQPLKAAAIFEELGDLLKAKQIFIVFKLFDKAALICERQGHWKEAAKWHSHKRNKKRNFDRALQLLSGSVDEQAKALRTDIAKKACHGARYAGNRDKMKAYCEQMPRETAVTHLTSLKEWDVLGYFNPDRVGQAQIYASTGKFQKAVDILDIMLEEAAGENLYHDEYEEHTKTIDLLHSYLLKIGTSNALTRAREMCDEYKLPLLVKTQTVLCQAENFTERECNREAIKGDLLDCYRGNFETDQFSSLMVLSALFSIYGQSVHHEVGNSRMNIPDLIQWIHGAIHTLLKDFSSSRYGPLLPMVMPYYEGHALQEQSGLVSYKLTNMQLCRALRWMGITPVEGSVEVPATTCTVQIAHCKASIVADFYYHTRKVLWCLLQHVEQDVIKKTFDMTSKDTLQLSNNKYIVGTLGKERVAYIAQGLKLCSCLSKLSRESKKFVRDCIPHVRQLASADDRAIRHLDFLWCVQKWFHGMLGTRWSGLSRNACFKLEDSHLSVLKSILKTYKTTDNVFLRRPREICHYFTSFFHPVKLTTNPNLSYWLLRLVMNCEMKSYGGRHYEFVGEFFRSTAIKVVNKVPASSLPSKKYAGEARAKKQMICRGDTGNWEIEGNCLLRTLNYLHFDMNSASPLKASRMLSLFLGRTIHFETRLTHEDRPRLCAEVFLDLLEWQSYLLLTGLHEKFVLPSHICTAVEFFVRRRYPRDYYGLEKKGYWSVSPYSKEETMFFLFQWSKNHFSRGTSFIGDLKSLHQAYWYFVTEVLPPQTDREMTLEAHIMKLTKVNLSNYNKDLKNLSSKEQCSHVLPFDHLSSRAFILLSCMLLNLGEVVAAKQIDGLGGDFLWALVECLKKLEVRDSKIGVSTLIQNREWRIRDLRAALVQSSRSLGVGLCCTPLSDKTDAADPSHRLFSQSGTHSAHIVCVKAYEASAIKKKLKEHPDEVYLEIRQAAPLLGQSSEAREYAATVIQHAWKQVMTFRKVLRNKWIRDRMAQWLRRARLSKEKRDALAQISVQQEETHLLFDDAKQRLKWVHMGLQFKPIDKHTCTVCPKGRSAHDFVYHAYCIAAFQKYEQGQKDVEKEMRRLGALQKRVQNLRKVATDANQNDTDLTLHEISEHLCAKSLQECIRTTEDLRQWARIEEIKDHCKALQKVLYISGKDIDKVEHELNAELQDQKNMAQDIDMGEDGWDDHPVELKTDRKKANKHMKGQKKKKAKK